MNYRTTQGELTIELDGFLRTSDNSPYDLVYVQDNLIRRWKLRGGDLIAGPIHGPIEDMRYPALLDVREINGNLPER